MPGYTYGDLKALFELTGIGTSYSKRLGYLTVARGDGLFGEGVDKDDIEKSALAACHALDEARVKDKHHV